MPEPAVSGSGYETLYIISINAMEKTQQNTLISITDGRTFFLFLEILYLIVSKLVRCWSLAPLVYVPNSEMTLIKKNPNGSTRPPDHEIVVFLFSQLIFGKS